MIIIQDGSYVSPIQIYENMEHISDFKDDKGVLVADYDGLNMKKEMNPDSELGGIFDK